MPLEATVPDTENVLDPNPRVVSHELLTRHTFQPATVLNLLAAAWLQFMVHDWMSHGKNHKSNPFEVEVADPDWQGAQIPSNACVRVSMASSPDTLIR